MKQRELVELLRRRAIELTQGRHIVTLHQEGSTVTATCHFSDGRVLETEFTLDDLVCESQGVSGAEPPSADEVAFCRLTRDFSAARA